MGGILSRNAPISPFLTLEEKVRIGAFREVCDKMNEVESSDFIENLPPRWRFCIYYFQNWGMLFELPLHLIYHCLFFLVFALVSIPFKFFSFCECDKENKLISQTTPSNGQEVRNENQGNTAIANSHLSELEAAEANEYDGEKLDTADAIPVGSTQTAREYLEPGWLNFLQRQTSHHSFLVSVYAAMIPVIIWNIFNPYELVAFISDAYFIPFDRPPVPKYRQNRRRRNGEEDCCPSPSFSTTYMCDDGGCFWISLIACACWPFLCISICIEDAEHEMVLFAPYKDTYGKRKAQLQAKTDEEYLNEFVRDRDSPLGIARRHPERFIRSLFFSLGGIQCLHASKLCGPCCSCCRCCYSTFSGTGQKWENKFQIQSKIKTANFYQDYFSVSSFDELVRERLQERQESSADTNIAVASTRAKQIKSTLGRVGSAGATRLSAKARKLLTQFRQGSNREKSPPTMTMSRDGVDNNV
mmetsp:Transcript_11320/g.12969  ORF Transcript_11320/g.12969 Transcript_11320/m.12969 type:complete len:471 (-) Transcript_11320:909-2321(-)